MSEEHVYEEMIRHFEEQDQEVEEMELRFAFEKFKETSDYQKWTESDEYKKWNSKSEEDYANSEEYKPLEELVWSEWMKQSNLK